MAGHPSGESSRSAVSRGRSDRGWPRSVPHAIGPAMGPTRRARTSRHRWRHRIRPRHGMDQEGAAREPVVVRGVDGVRHPVCSGRRRHDHGSLRTRKRRGIIDAAVRPRYRRDLIAFSTGPARRDAFSTADLAPRPPRPSRRVSLFPLEDAGRDLGSHLHDRVDRRDGRLCRRVRRRGRVRHRNARRGRRPHASAGHHGRELVA